MNTTDAVPAAGAVNSASAKNTACAPELFALRLAISRLGFLSFAEKKLLEKKLDTVSRLALLSIDDLSLLIGRVIDTKLWRTQDAERLADSDQKIMAAFRIAVMFYDDPLWPPLLNEIYDPPYALFYRGNPAVLTPQKKACVSIVGTRRPTGRGMQSTADLAFALAEKGCTVVSGLALGTDACAHSGALRSAAGKTAAVLGSGVDTITPVSNKNIAAAILNSGGCILSEYAPGVGAEKWHFPQRNRIISALSAATVIMEAPAGSGALITADFALEQNRELCFHTCALDYPEAPSAKPLSAAKKRRQVKNYIEEGARIVSDAQDVLSLLAPEYVEL